MKYIDADLLRKEIEHRIDILSDVSIKCAKNDDMEMHNYYRGKAISLDELLSFIDSLRQEQPNTDLDADIEMEWDSFNKHSAEYGEESEEVVWLNWYSFNDVARHFFELGRQAKPEVFDTVAFQKGVEEGRRLEREDALTIADIEKLHTFLYAAKNNKHGAFTFTRLSDEQYEEVLRRFNNAIKEE